MFHIFQNLSILFILSVLAEHSLAGSSRNFAKAWPIEYVSRLLSVILGISILNSRPFCISSIRMSTLLQALSRASFWFHFLLECILFCTNVEAAKLHFLRRFSVWYICFVFLQGSRRWTQKCDGRGCLDVGGWAFAQLHGACRVASSSGGRVWECCNDEMKGTINAEQEYMYIYIYIDTS